MQEYEKEGLLSEGKTKRIYAAKGHAKWVIVENKNDITGWDDPDFTKKFDTKGGYATSTTSRVFELVKQTPIPVAFIKQLSETEFLAKKCTMIPLEVVVRRIAFGSFLKRHPEYKVSDVRDSHRFHELQVEFFLKTSGGKLVIERKELVWGLDPKKGEEDPIIMNPYDVDWRLFHSKKPAWDDEADLSRVIKIYEVIEGAQPAIKKMEEIIRRVFLLLEGAWNILGLRLIDLKLEFGITEDGELVIADVIDGDSWRLWKGWDDYSKQSFRDGEDLSEVERKYGVVASLVEQFRVPKQALIWWRGSEKDDFYEIDYYGIDIVQIELSGHKKTRVSLDQLERILRDYPDGGVIIAKVGKSDALGPMLAAHTTWPVIAIPATFKKFPDDVWSSLSMPSNVPLLVAIDDGNAAQAALNILAAKNPLLYMQRQYEVEEINRAPKD